MYIEVVNRFVEREKMMSGVRGVWPWMKHMVGIDSWGRKEESKDLKCAYMDLSILISNCVLLINLVIFCLKSFVSACLSQ